MGPGFMVYLTCSVFGLDGRDASKNGLKRLHSAPLHADVQSQLAGSSAIQPFAASGESWHGVYTFSCVFLEFRLTLRLGPWGSIKYLDTPTGESLEILRGGGG